MRPRKATRWRRSRIVSVSERSRCMVLTSLRNEFDNTKTIAYILHRVKMASPGRVGSGALGENSKECTDLEMVLEGMAKREVHVDLVVVPSPDALM